MSEFKESNAAQRKADFAEFMARDQDFICGWGRQAYLRGRTTIESMPDSADFKENTDVILDAMRQGFTDGNKDACVFVQPFDHANHLLEYSRVMAMYAYARTAAGLASGKGSYEQLAGEAARTAEYFFMHPERFLESYAKQGKIPLGNDDQLMVMGMSPLYTGRHPRKSPVSAFVMTRLGDASKVRETHFRQAQSVVAEAGDRVAIPYPPLLPYILPGDERFAMPSFSAFLPLITLMKERFPGLLRGNPVEIAAALTRHLAANIVEGYVADQTRINAGSIMELLRQHGFLEETAD